VTVLGQDTFVPPDIGWFALSPLLVLLGGGLFLLLAGALTPPWPRGLYALVTSVTAIAAGVLAIMQWDDISEDGVTTLVGGALAFDHFAMFVTITACVAVLLVALISDEYLRREGLDGPEYYALYLIAALGGIVMASANDLIVLFLGLETLSLGFYVLAAGHRRRTKSQEAGIKYFVLGGFASAFLLYGIALIYGAAGSTNITEIVARLQNVVPVENNDALILAGLGLLLVGLAFKVSAVPFHIWAPDVYEGAPSPVTGFMAAAGKVAAFGAMVRVLIVALPFYRDDWRPVIWVLAIASMVIGSTLAVVQTDVKRLLAYSSISHAGYILVGIEAAGHHAGQADAGSGVPSVAFYLLAYTVMVVGSFGVVALVSRGGDDATGLVAFRGLSSRRPLIAVVFTVFLLAQAGVPFTSGFIAKFGVIQAAVEEHSYAIAVIAMLAAVIGAYLYLRIIVSVWISDPAADDVRAAGVHRPALFGTVGVAIAAVFTIAVGLAPDWLLDATDTVTNFAG
jgi:NADH-quinone oxidoreductase subunit N